ncbi:GH25 family lysozyme [Enterococcus sp. C76]|uniref:GH25 family lysozyme n=1 Tax=Enterococcus sp. C76 TaxID=3231334 RepID=UPI0034A07074
MTLNGIDISSFQSGIDLSSVPADFVFIKATGGTGYINPDCDRAFQQALKAGKKLGVYHFAHEQGYQGTTEQEAEFFLNNIQGYIGKAILMLDWESDNSGDIAWAKRWLDYVQAKTGIKPLIYMSTSVLAAHNFSCIRNADYGLWLASYPNMNPTGYRQPSPPNGGEWGTNVAMYQYTSNGRLDNWNGSLDLDVFYGDEATWDAYAKAKISKIPKKQRTLSDHNEAVAASKAVHQGNAWGKLEFFNLVAKNKLRVAGWLVPDKPEGPIGKYAEVLIMEHGTTKEITRIASQGIKRPDVKKNYGYKGGDALGMDVTVDLSWVKKGTKIDVIFRRCNQLNGEGMVNDVRISNIYLTL